MRTLRPARLLTQETGHGSRRPCMFSAERDSSEPNGSDAVGSAFKRERRRTGLNKLLPGSLRRMGVWGRADKSTSEGAVLFRAIPRRRFGYFAAVGKVTRRRRNSVQSTFPKTEKENGLRRVTFQRRKVTKVLRDCGPGPLGSHDVSLRKPVRRG